MQQLEAAAHTEEEGQKKSIVVPDNKRLRPFFFMRQLEKTMTGLDGAFFTETLFVPRYVWYQRDAKVQDVDRKLQYLEALKKEFQKVGILYSKNCISKDKNVRIYCFKICTGGRQADDVCDVRTRLYVTRICEWGHLLNKPWCFPTWNRNTSCLIDESCRQDHGPALLAAEHDWLRRSDVENANTWWGTPEFL